MDVKLVRPAELTVEQLSIWSQLQRADKAVDSPYFRPEFTLAVSSVRDDVEVAVLYEGSEIVGFFPFQRKQFNVGKPVGGRLSDFQGVIVRKDLVWSVDDLMRGCRLTAWDFDHLITSQEAFSPHHWLTDDSPYLDLSNGFDAYVAEIHRTKSKQIKNVLRKSRKAEREIGPLRMEFNTTDDAVFQTGQNVFPGDLGGVAPFFILDFHLRALMQKFDKIITDMLYQENILDPYPSIRSIEPSAISDQQEHPAES